MGRGECVGRGNASGGKPLGSNLVNGAARPAPGLDAANWKGLAMHAIHYRYADVDGRRLFYREAGAKDAPAVLLLHGFPASRSCSGT